MASPSFLPAGRSRRRRHVLVALLVAASLALAGCSVLGSANGLPTGETAADRYTSLDGYSGTLKISYTGETQAENRTMRVTIRPSTGQTRVRVLEGQSSDGNIYVYNGSQIIMYNATKNEYRRIRLSGANRTQQFRERIRRFVNRARKGAKTTAGDASVSPLPVVPGGSNTNRADGANTTLKYSYLGTETVLGRTAHVIRVARVNDTGGGVVNRTVWLDSEWFLTLKAHSVMRFDDETVTFSMRFTNITITPGISAETFTFDPPPNATVNESRSVTASVYDSREALDAATTMDVPDPSVPEGFELDRARSISGKDIRGVTLLYRRDTAQLFVSKQNRTDHATLPNGERVLIGNRTGRYAQFGSSARVSWTCDGNRYTVAGEVSKNVLVAVAESMVCD